jgi:tetratricopeptide (TPR) repeat protein
LEIAHQIHADFLAVTILGNLGLFKHVAGDWDAAIADYTQAAALAERLGNQAQRALMEMNLGQSWIARGDDETALRYLSNSLALARDNGLDEYILGCLSGLVDLYLRRGEADLAEPYLTEAMQIVRKFEQNYRLSELYRWWSELRLFRSDVSEAMNNAAKALELARRLGDPIDEGLSLRTYGQALRAAGDLNDALMMFQQSAELLADEPYEAARTKHALALTLGDLGNAEQGHAMLVDAQAIFARLGARRDMQAAEAQMARISRQHD